MLSKPILHSRIGKWAFPLTGHFFTYAPLRSMKGQIISNFIIDQTIVEVIILV